MILTIPIIRSLIITALAVSAPVTIKGNNVGKVKEIIYDFETGKTRVAFSVDKQLQFSKNSTISLFQTGLMGGNALQLFRQKIIRWLKTEI